MAAPHALLRLPLCALAAAAPGGPAGPARHDVAVLPDDFEVVHVLQNLDLPTALRFAPDGHLFFADRGGSVFACEPPVYDAPQRVLDLEDEVNSSGDRGLLALALHPQFVADGGDRSWIYLLYTSSPAPGVDTLWNEDDQFSWTTLTRYRLSAAGEHGIEPVPDSRQVLLGERLPDGSVPDGIASVHLSHGPGTLAFGADGTLLVTAGDGAHFDFVDAGGQDPAAFDDWTDPTTGLVGPNPADQDCGAFRAQSLASLAGKLLRLDPETGLGLPSNPFYDGDLSSNASKIFALGLRNPYRLEVEPGTGSTDPALADPGRLWIGDVGQADYEELDLVDAPGLNFGWPCFEGPFPMDAYQAASPLAENPHACPDCSTPAAGALADPLLAWRRIGEELAVPAGIHFDAEGAAVPGFVGSCSVGGAFYTAGPYPSAYDGSFFFADFGGDRIRRAVLDARGQLESVHAFAESLNAIVDLERHPLTGELFLVQLAGDGYSSEISRVVFQLGIPEAQLVASPAAGLAPLEVALDGGGSFDPTGEPLEYRFDFGDGSPPLTTSSASVQHEFPVDGSYVVRLTVNDPGGSQDTAQALVVVGALPPQVTLVQPPGHLEPAVPGALGLEGLGLDPAGPELQLDWVIDLHHNDHVHPASLLASGAAASVQLDAHGEGDDLFYFRVELLGTAESGLQASDDAWVFPAGQTLDLTGTLGAIDRAAAQGATLDPAAGSNPDLEVVRDARLPDAAAPDPASWYASRTLEPAPAEDWFGIEYAGPATPYARFVEATWTLGEVSAEGGALLEPRVETRIDGAWTPVEGLSIEPPYPAAGALPASFGSYRFRFDPAAGDALRLIGAPSGSVGYVTVAELRVRALSSAALAHGELDVSDRGAPIARVLEQGLDPSSGPANPHPATLSNGTFGVLGSTSFWPSFDSSASVPLVEPDWFGIEFEVPQTIDQLTWQLGRAHDGGGRLAELDVEWRGAPDAPWEPVSGLLTSPPYDPATAPDYGLHTSRFDAVAASGVRLTGSAPDAAGFGAFAELRAVGPQPAPDCGSAPYGATSGDFGLTLASQTAPLPGAPMALRVTGAAGAGAGALLYAQAPGALQLLDGHVLLVDPGAYKILPLAFGPDGEAWFAFTWPTAPGAFANGLYVQAAAADASSIDGVDLSAGLAIRPCSAAGPGG